MQGTKYEGTTTTTTTTISRSTLSNVDTTIPYRFVGSYEYDKAIKMLERLIAISTPEQVKAYDEILRERAEFNYINGVASTFAKRPDLKNATKDQRQKFNDQFKKKGLAWMMALARIELASTMSLYGDQEFPFESVGVGEFDMQAFIQVLADDVVAHMRSLSNEPMFVEVLRPGHYPDSSSIAYLRRLKLIKDMLKTLGRVSPPEVISRIEPYHRELEKYETRLVKNVAKKERYSVTSNSNTSDWSRFYGTQEVTVGQCEGAVDRLTSRGTPRGNTVPGRQGTGFNKSVTPRTSGLN